MARSHRRHVIVPAALAAAALAAAPNLATAQTAPVVGAGVGEGAEIADAAYPMIGCRSMNGFLIVWGPSSAVLAVQGAVVAGNGYVSMNLSGCDGWQGGSGTFSGAASGSSATGGSYNCPMNGSYLRVAAIFEAVASGPCTVDSVTTSTATLAAVAGWVPFPIYWSGIMAPNEATVVMGWSLS